jgi:hypothetical protein
MHSITLERKNTSKVLPEVPLNPSRMPDRTAAKLEEKIDDSYPRIFEQL